MDIRRDDVRGPEIAALLQEHLRDMYRVSPPESVHALDLDALLTRFGVFGSNNLILLRIKMAIAP
jgi:hypothetical protein